MQINKLYYFVCVAKYLNFTKAAEECHLAQSAMSQQINSLENELGFKLFNRSSRNVSLTDSGKVFYESVKSIIDDYNEAIRKAESVACGYKGIITLGICGETESLVIPDMLNKFISEYPLVEIKFIKAHFDNIIKELEEKMYDAVFIWPYDIENSKEIQFKEIHSCPVCAIMNSKNPLASKNKVTREDLSKENQIVICNNMQSNTYNRFRSFFSDEQIKNLKIITVPNDSILQIMLDLNKGISIGPDVLKEIKNQRFAVVDIDMEGEPHYVSYGIAYMKTNSNPCLDLFVKSINS